MLKFSEQIKNNASFSMKKIKKNTEYLVHRISKWSAERLDFCFIAIVLPLYSVLYCHC